MAAKSDGLHKVAGTRKGEPKKGTPPGLPGPKTLGLVDVFLFLLDSRIPHTSLRLAEPYLSKMRRVYVLTKPDLADPGVTREWLRWFGSQGLPAFPVDCRTGEGLGGLLEFLKEKRSQVLLRFKGKVIDRPLRLMLFGLPNVGKSSLANRLLGTTKAPFGAKPGLTRGSHWLRGREFLELLDTPGVIDTSLIDDEIRKKLAVTWAIPETAYDDEEVGFWLAEKVLGYSDPLSFLSNFGLSRGFLSQGGRVDLIRASKALIQEFREGKLGRISLERPYKTTELKGEAGNEVIPEDSRVPPVRQDL